MEKILVVEDNTDVRENITEILELANYEVVEAENGKVGVSKAVKEIPDLIICDIMMPELDGYGVLQIISQNPITAGIPFIFLTAKAEKSDVRHGMNLGADDYVTKPFEESELLSAIEIRLKRNEILKKDFDNDLSGLHEFLDEVKGRKELINLSNDRKIRKFKKKEVVYHEDTYANYLYFVVNGEFKTTRTDEYGKEIIIDVHHNGDFVGYLGVLEGPEYGETLTAMQEGELAIVPKSDFHELLKKNRDVAHRFIKMMANNLQEKEARLLKIAYSSVRERVADTLVQLAGQVEAEDNGRRSIQISRDNLAGIVGTATESLIRMLSEFKQDKLIEATGKTIIVLNIEGLKKIYSPYH